VVAVSFARNQDGDYVNFAFGATDSSFASSVQSITRIIREIKPGPLRAAMVRRLLRHEVGHMFGLPSRNRLRTEEKLGTHCTNICTMRQGMSIREFAQLTKEEDTMGIHFCADCRADFVAARLRYRPLTDESH
jgi:predicted Zn-dependent protease